MTLHQLKAQRQARGFVSPVSVHASRPSVSTQSTTPFLSLSSTRAPNCPERRWACPAQAALLQSRPPGVTVELGTCTALWTGSRSRARASSPGPQAAAGPGVLTLIGVSLARSQSLGAPHVTPPCATHWSPGPVLNLVFPFPWSEPLGLGALESFPSSQLQSGHSQLIHVALIVLDLRSGGVGGMGTVSLPFLPRGSGANMSPRAWP